jgi:hypothetical protein
MVDWSASDAPPMDGIEPKSHFCRPSRGAVDHLGLVETNTPPLNTGQWRGNRRVALSITEPSSIRSIAVGKVNIVKLLGQNLISGDHNIKLGKCFGLVVSFKVNTSKESRILLKFCTYVMNVRRTHII